MNIDKKIYSGGMDQDTDPHFIKAGDYRYALNCIVGNDETGNLGSVSNVKGTIQVDFDLPIGDNRCIGAFNDSKNSRVFFFIYNSNGDHTIQEYDSKSEVVSLLVKSKVLNFDWQNLVNDVDVVDDNLLYFTDGWNPPRKINIEKARLTGTPEGYSNRINDGVATSTIPELQDTLIDNPVMIVEEYFDAIKYGPYKQPSIEFFNDPNDATSTKVDKNAFQFKYKWIYDDGEHSVYSPISQVGLQNDKATFFGDLTSVLELSGALNSANASGVFNIPKLYSNNAIPGGSWAGAIALHQQQNQQEYLANGEVLSSSPFGHAGANSTEVEYPIIPSSAGQVQGSGNYSNGVYTASIAGAYNLNVEIEATVESVLDANGVDVSAMPLLKRFKEPSAATSIFKNDVSASIHANKPTLNGSSISWNGGVNIDYSSWTETALGNTITYSSPTQGFVLNNSQQPITAQQGSGYSLEISSPKQNLVKGFWGDSFGDKDSDDAKWQKALYILGEDISTYNGTGKLEFDLYDSYNNVTDNPNDIAGIGSYGVMSFPPTMLQRVTHYDQYEPTGNYTPKNAASNMGAPATFISFSSGNKPLSAHKISYLRYDGQKDVDSSLIPKIKLFVRHTSNSGVVTDYPMTDASGADKIIYSTNTPTSYSYSNSAFNLAAGDSVKIIAKSFSHVYNCYLDIETGVFYKETAGIGANISNMTFTLKYDNTTTSVYTPQSSSSSNSKKNTVRVTVQTGSELVKKISVAVRDMEVGATPDFYKLVEIDKEELGLADFTTYDILFKNDKRIKEVLDIAESNRIYDFLPRIARTQEYLSNNRIAYANILEGYNPLPKSGDEDEKMDVNIHRCFAFEITGSSYHGTFNMLENLTNYPAGVNNFHPNVSGSNTYRFGASKGDTLTPTYLVYGGSNDSAIGCQIVQAGQNDIESLPIGIGTNVDDFYWGDGANSNAGGWVIDRNGIINPDKPTLKRGGRYTYGLVYYDRAGRASMVNSYSNPDSPNSMVVDVPWYHEAPTIVRNKKNFQANGNFQWHSNFTAKSWAIGEWTPDSYLADSYRQALNGRTMLPPNIFWEIFHKPPKWATHYQWVMTKNENTDYFVQGITGGPVDDNLSPVDHFLFYRSEDGEQEIGKPWSDSTVRGDIDAIKYMDINIEHFYNYEKYYSNGKDEPVMSYSYKKGDKIRFIGWRQGLGYYNNSAYKWWRLTGVGNSVQVGGYPPNITNPNFVTRQWGHGLYKEYIEFEVNNVVYIDGQAHLRVTGDFSIFKQDLYYTGPTTDGHQSIDANNSGNSKNLTYDALLPNSMFEIYRAKSEIAPSDKIFYEFGQTFRIGNPHTEDRYHMGDIQDQDRSVNLNDGSTRPARGCFGAKFSIINHPVPVHNANGENRRVIPMTTRSYGDVYTRNRVHVIDDRNATQIPTLNGTTMTTVNYDEAGSGTAKHLIDEYYVQDEHINDNVPKYQITSGLGRPHLQNDELGEEWRYATARFSDPMIEDTNKNQLNTFYESQNPTLGITSGFVDYEKDYGSIQKIISRETDLVILHENKATKALVSKDILTKASGDGDVSISATPLSQATPYVGDFGVGLNPESVAVFNNTIYFADLRNGSILRLSRDGITQVSEYGMHKYFKDKSRELLSEEGAVVNVYGEYNRDYNEYIVTFDSALQSEYLTDPVANVFLDTETPKMKTFITKNTKS